MGEKGRKARGQVFVGRLQDATQDLTPTSVVPGLDERIKSRPLGLVSSVGKHEDSEAVLLLPKRVGDREQDTHPGRGGERLLGREQSLDSPLPNSADQRGQGRANGCRRDLVRSSAHELIDQPDYLRLTIRRRAAFLDEVRRAVPRGLVMPVSYTHLRAHETRHDLVCRLLLEK